MPDIASPPSSQATAGPEPATTAIADARTTALATRPAELDLLPIDGLPRWVGPTLHRLLFRMLSMVEQPLANMRGAVTPNAGYFRRDRHRHPSIDAARYRLRVTGVASPRTFSLQELRELPREDRLLVMECAGNGNHWMGSAGLVGQARWSGVALETLLDQCGGPGPATHFAFHGLDPIPLIRRGYHYGLALDELVRARALLAFEMNGEPLPRARGFPVRLVVPGIYSMSHVKWLGHIEGKTAPHRGIHNRFVFTNKEFRDGRWQRVQARWIGLKSLITRCIAVPEGWLLTGWAWGGDQPIEAVSVTTDGGKTWSEAQVYRPLELIEDQGRLRPIDTERAWVVFEYLWRGAVPGPHMIASRAQAADGTLQRAEEDPNVRGHFDQQRIKWRRVRVP